jgi:hypothetical protein
LLSGLLVRVARGDRDRGTCGGIHDASPLSSAGKVIVNGTRGQAIAPAPTAVTLNVMVTRVAVSLAVSQPPQFHRFAKYSPVGGKGLARRPAPGPHSGTGGDPAATVASNTIGPVAATDKVNAATTSIMGVLERVAGIGREDMADGSRHSGSVTRIELVEGDDGPARRLANATGPVIETPRESGLVAARRPR